MSAGRAVRGAAAEAVALACLVAACGLFTPPADPDLRVRGFDAEWLYPGEEVPCGGVDNWCEDNRAEIERWARANAPDRLPITALTFHSARDASGQGVIMARSGGSTWIAVVTFADGTRTALLTGCGVGINPDMCFTQR